MHYGLRIIIALYAAAILGLLIGNLVVGLLILNQSTRAADASVALNDDIEAIKERLRQIYEWIITHFPP